MMEFQVRVIMREGDTEADVQIDYADGMSEEKIQELIQLLKEFAKGANQP